MKIQAMIVEDEELAQKRVLRLLQNFSDKIEIIACANNGQDAVEKINKLHPELIFLDIKLPGMTGFDVADELEYQPWIIFTTAFDEYAIQAFNAFTVDYLLKPIRLQKLAKAIQKYEQIRNEKEKSEHTKFIVKVGAAHIFLDFDDIMFFEADKKYITVHTKKKQYVISESLKQLTDKLDDRFFQVYRSIIVNKDYILKIVSLSSRKFILQLTNKVELPLSNEAKKRLTK